MPQIKTVKKLVKNRDSTIDFLRGLAVVFMIFIHAAAYFWQDRPVSTLSNYSQFVVQLFVFCSAYLFFKGSSNAKNSPQTYGRRFLRLYLPYLTLYALPMMMIYAVLSLNNFNLDSFLKLITLGQGRDVGWLVVLFTYILVLTPFIFYLYNKHRLLFYTYTFLSFSTSIWLLFYSFNVSFRYVMWLPWSSFLIFSLYFALSKKTLKFYFFTTIIALSIFLLSRNLLENLDKTLLFTENKYPPNIYYLSYAGFIITILYGLLRVLKNIKFINSQVQIFLNFMSRFSYPIFFIHFLLVEIITRLSWHKIFGPYLFFLILIFGSVLIIKIYFYLKKKLTFFQR